MAGGLCPPQISGPLLQPGSRRPWFWPEFGDFPVSKMQILIPASLSCGFDVVAEGRTGDRAFVNCKVLCW